MRSLEGIRVLDLTRLLPGPFASLVLADLGATVDKVEDPGSGDYLRYVPPQVAGESVAFHALNRGKRSAVLDLKNDAGVAAFRRIVKSYDVLFEQFRPGVLARLGVGHDALLADNPRLIVCALTGYGQSGPLSSRAGHDINYLGRAGIMGLMGPTDRPPQLPSFQLADIGGGLWCVVAILAALRERDRSGRGAVLDMAMADAVVPFAASALSRLLGGEVPVRGGEHLTGGIAPYNTYWSSDGEAMTLGALEPKFLKKFCDAAGIEFDPSALVPGPHQEELKRTYARVFAGRTRAEWERIGREQDCCLEPALRPDELLLDPHIIAREIFFDQQTDAGTVRAFRTPVTSREVEPRRAPRTGEHTDTILLEAGFSKEEITELRRKGAVR